MLAPEGTCCVRRHDGGSHGGSLLVFKTCSLLPVDNGEVGTAIVDTRKFESFESHTLMTHRRLVPILSPKKFK